MQKVIVVGGFKEILELCQAEDFQIIGVIDHEPVPGYPYLGDDQNAKSVYDSYPSIPVVIAPDAPAVRQRLVRHYAAIGFRFATVVSRKATISPTATIGEGSVIQAFSYLSSDARIGKFCKVNVMANVMHDAQVGDFSTLAPNSVVLGRVTLGEACYVGANATILPEIEMAGKCVVGAGAVVTKNCLAEGAILKGVPARQS